MIGGPIRRVPHPVRPAMLNFRPNKLIFGPNQVGEALQGHFLALLQKLARGLLHNAREGMPIFRVEKPHIAML